MKQRANTQPQWMTIATGVRTAIERGELRPGERLASETDLAAQWNVSAVTAHKAMQELQREGWVVRKRRAGTVVAERRALPARRVAMVFTDLADMPQAAYVRGIRDALSDAVKLIPYDTRHDPVREAAYLREIETNKEADALVCYASCAPENTRLLVSLARQTPVVFVDRLPGDLTKEGLLVDAVMTDNAGSIQTGLEFLRSHGHQRIAYFMEDAAPYVSSIHERLAGYQEFMREVCGDDSERWVRKLPRAIPPALYFERVQEYLEALLQGPEPITAVCCQQDKLMAAVLEACVHLGIRVPEQLEVVSFNDIDPSLQPLGRSVHRLVQRAGEMGGIAARRLIARLENPDLSPQVMRLLADLYPATLRGSHSSSRSADPYRVAPPVETAEKKSSSPSDNNNHTVYCDNNRMV
jgi:LacI family transcriptional regulator